jgi:hypothetical protein
MLGKRQIMKLWTFIAILIAGCMVGHLIHHRVEKHREIRKMCEEFPELEDQISVKSHQEITNEYRCLLIKRGNEMFGIKE